MAEPQLPPPRWSELPLDLGCLVLRSLPAYVDRLKFALVCTNWSDAARQFHRLHQKHPALPLLAFPDRTFYILPRDDRFRFPGCGFAGYDSVCGNWLVFNRDDACFLVDPFARVTVTLPALSSVRLRPPDAVAGWSYEGHAEPYNTWMHLKDSKDLDMMKIILCAPNLAAALVGAVKARQILMCQPGSLSWSVRAYDECKAFEDVVFYQGKLYAVVEDGDLFVFNIGQDQDQGTGDPEVSRIGRVIKGEPWYLNVSDDDNTLLCKKIYLVESRGALLMIRRMIRCWTIGGPQPGEGPRFEVFRADFQQSLWVKVTAMEDDDPVLFLGRRCSRAVSVSQYRLSGGRIFFLDDEQESLMDGRSNEEDIIFIRAFDITSGQVTSPYPEISWRRREDGMKLASWLFPED